MTDYSIVAFCGGGKSVPASIHVNSCAEVYRVSGGWHAASSTIGAGSTVGFGSYATAALQAASLLYSMSQKAPGMPGAPGEPKDTTEAAAYAEAQALRKRRGAASTILTGPLGVVGTGKQALGA